MKVGWGSACIMEPASDGKGMKAANFKKGKWCWLCDDVEALSPMETIDEFVRPSKEIFH